MRHSIEMEKLTLGVCYYPEHWDRALWKDDLQRMKQYGIEVIRLAEFSWALMEPEEGKYDFSFWDEFLALAAEENMKVVFCTPTATPPAWLSEKYPETLNADGDGNLMYHGMRGQHNLTSPKYLEFCEKITRRMAEHFNKYDCIIGWQLDNEVNCEANEYYSKSDHEAFRAFLKERFGTLDNLNEKMGTIFWSQTYTDWDQIHLARRSTAGTGLANPHMQLEQVRFISHSAVHYLALQASIVRETAGDRFITTNGIFENLDYQKLMESGVDFIMYDSYPNFAYAMDRPDGGEGDLKDRNFSFNLARTRAISPLFGIMEQQAGPGGWNFRIHQASPKPGQLRLWTMQSVAHGADFVSFFRWRTCSFGTEIYWHGLNDYSNRPNRRHHGRRLRPLVEAVDRSRRDRQGDQRDGADRTFDGPLRGVQRAVPIPAHRGAGPAAVGIRRTRPPQPAAGTPEHLPREIAAPRSVAAALQGSVTTPE